MGTLSAKKVLFPLYESRLSSPIWFRVSFFFFFFQSNFSRGGRGFFFSYSEECRAVDLMAACKSIFDKPARASARLNVETALVFLLSVFLSNYLFSSLMRTRKLTGDVLGSISRTCTGSKPRATADQTSSLLIQHVYPQVPLTRMRRTSRLGTPRSISGCWARPVRRRRRRAFGRVADA
jgi:hypothetical protein